MLLISREPGQWERIPADQVIAMISQPPPQVPCVLKNVASHRIAVVTQQRPLTARRYCRLVTI